MAVVSLPWGQEKANFRTCTATGLQVDLAAQRLIVGNAVAAVVFLLIGGIMALLIALTRWQAVHLLSAVWFYRTLTAHGFDMLVAWIVFFEVAGLYFGSAIMLNARLVGARLAWVAYGLMLAGALLVNAIVMLGQADVMFTAYVPLKAHPLFYLGMILFAVGALIAVGIFFATLIVAKMEKRYQGSLPLVVYGLGTAAIIATYTLISGALTFVPALFWSLGWMTNFDPGYYRNLFWSFGHPAQQVNLAAMVSVWYLLAALTTGAKPVNEKFSRLAFVLYLFFINLGSVHHLLVDPGLSFAYKVVNTSYGMYLAVLGSLIHAFSIPAALEVALRAQGHTHGLLGWLRKAPWREPGFAALVLSLFIFGWVGGVTGVTIGTEQLNLTIHNTLRVPGHFHATVVGGTTMAFMGITYYLIPLVFRRELKLKRWATWQPYIYGFGMVLLSIGMIASGIQGAPRRHWDISFAQAPFPAVIPGTMHLTLAIFGIGSLIAIVGGAMYLAVVLTSVLSRKQYSATSATLVLAPGAQVAAHDHEEHIEPKGSFVLVLAFLLFFAAYYLGNWWLLSGKWFVR
jgi:cytochrome c oxidase subunit 1